MIGRQLDDGIVRLLSCFLKVWCKVISITLKTLEINYPLFFFAYVEDGIGVLSFIVKLPLPRIKFSLQIVVFGMNFRQKAGLGDFGLYAEKVKKNFEISGKFDGAVHDVLMNGNLTAGDVEMAVEVGVFKGKVGNGAAYLTAWDIGVVRMSFGEN